MVGRVSSPFWPSPVNGISTPKDHRIERYLDPFCYVCLESLAPLGSVPYTTSLARDSTEARAWRSSSLRKDGI